MKIDKSKLTKALKQIGIFIGKTNIDKTVSFVHFRNEDNKAMLFATDFASAGRAYFDTDEKDVFEFCIEYNQLMQTVRARGNELTATIFTDRAGENGEKMSGIEFTDGKSKFEWALHENDSLKAQEDASVIPTDIPYFEIDAKTLKNAIRESGFARNEKDTQTPYITGVNFVGCGDDLTMVSTDRHRVAGWKKPNSESLEGMVANTVSGIMSPKTIASISLYDDEDTVRVYMEESKIVLVSDKLEAYASKILCNFPDVQRMFKNDIVSEYKLSAKALKESIEIVVANDDTIQMDFKEDSITIRSVRGSGDGMLDDTFPCERVKGFDESVLVKPTDLLDVVKNTSDDNLTIAFRPLDNNFKMLSYSLEDGAYGLIAPKKR